LVGLAEVDVAGFGFAVVAVAVCVEGEQSFGFVFAELDFGARGRDYVPGFGSWFDIAGDWTTSRT
jgi:hypothetical protein